MNYDLGWFEETFTDGRRLLWHAGGIDGFGSLMGFFPREGVGFAILTNLEPSLSGLFNFSVESSVFDLLFGLNGKIPGTLAGLAPQISKSRSDVAATTHAVDPSTTAPYLGLYADGFQLQMDGANLVLSHDIRRMTVLAVQGGDYLIFDGPGAVAGKSLVLTGDGTGEKTLTVQGFDPVLWLTGD